MLKYINVKNALSLSLLVLAALFSSCDNDKNDGAGAKVVLNSFGPAVLRGGELKFIGDNLNKVTAIILPEDVEIQASSFKTHTANLITIDVPDEVVEGVVTLKTPNGEIVTKTSLSILEPITIISIPAEAVRPGDVITIEGTYLNLIQEVIFSTNKSVTNFDAQSRTSLSVRVPDDAQTGALRLLDSEEIPNEIETETELIVTLPTVASFSPNPVKAGSTLTITGTDLDLVTAVEFAGGQSVDTASVDFISTTASAIVVKVPGETDEGIINLVTASAVRVKSSGSLTMVVPTIGTITPLPAKTGGEITVTGINLDLVSQVIFGGDKAGVVKSGGTATSIVIEVPDDAKSGSIAFRTRANKTVNSANPIAMVKPSITNMPTQSALDADITIVGENLDIVKEVKFTGGTKGTIQSSTATQLVVTVPLGTKTGVVTIVADNSDEVLSTGGLTILADVPEFDNFPVWTQPGTKLILTGVKLNLTNEVIFPGNVKATQFGDRTSTLLEVYVPAGVDLGKDKITFTTYGTDITESSEIGFWSAEPVTAPSLVFFNFDGKNSWWGGVVVEGNAANNLDGSNYGKLDMGVLTGWTDLFWRNSQNDFPVTTIGVNVADYNFKFDIYVRTGITDGNLKFRFGDYYWCYGPDAPPAQGQVSTIPVTDGWVTVTIPVTDFRDNFGWGNPIADLNAVGNGQFGLAWDNGTADVDVLIDNVRFEHK